MIAQLDTRRAAVRQLQSEIELINRTLNSFMVGLDISWRDTMVIDFDECVITDVKREDEGAVQKPSPTGLDVGE